MRLVIVFCLCATFMSNSADTNKAKKYDSFMINDIRKLPSKIIELPVSSCGNTDPDLVLVDSIKVDLNKVVCNTDFYSYSTIFVSNDSVKKGNYFLNRNIVYKIYKACTSNKYCVVKDTSSYVKGDYAGLTVVNMEVFNHDSLLFKLGPFYDGWVLLLNDFLYVRSNSDPEGASCDDIYIYNYIGELIKKIFMANRIEVFNNGRNYLVERCVQDSESEIYEFGNVEDTITKQVAFRPLVHSHLIDYSVDQNVFIFGEKDRLIAINKECDTLWSKSVEKNRYYGVSLNSNGNLFAEFGNSEFMVVNSSTGKTVLDSKTISDITRKIGKYSNIAFINGGDILSVFITKLKKIDERRSSVERSYLAFYNMKGELLDLFETDFVLNMFKIETYNNNLLISSDRRNYIVEYDSQKIMGQ